MRIKDEQDMLAGFLLMRRGTRLIPILDSDEKYVSILKKYDPFLGDGQRQRRQVVQNLLDCMGILWNVVRRGKTICKTTNWCYKNYSSFFSYLCGWTEEEEKSAIISYSNQASILQKLTPAFG